MLAKPLIHLFFAYAIIILQAHICQVSSFTSPYPNKIILSNVFNTEHASGRYRQPRSSASTNSISHTPTSTTSTTRSQRSISQLHQSFFQDDEIEEGPDRLKSCIPYILPLLDGDSFGKYIYQRIPPLGAIHDVVLAPLVSVMQQQPLLSLGLFLLLSFGTRNSDMSRFVRFNAQQAVLLDVALIFPTLIGESFVPTVASTGGLLGNGGSAPPGPPLIPRSVDEFGCNFVFYVMYSAIIYSVSSNLRGKKPNQIPYISQAAEFTTGPY